MKSESARPIRNVALAGGTGLLGSLIAEALIESGQFNLTILSRGHQSTTHPAAKVAVVDYNDVEQLTKALKGQDAVVSTLSREATLLQIALIDAAVIAGVKRVLPSEFGSNLQNPRARSLPNYKNKVRVEEYLEEKARASEITYTFIYSNMFLDWAVEARILLDIGKGIVHLYNGGERPVSMIRMPTVARAAVGVLMHPEETRNRPVYVHEAVLSQRDLLALAKQVFPEKEWYEDTIDLEDLERKLKAGIEEGVPKMSIFHAYAIRGGVGVGFGNQFGETDNDLLDIKAMSDEDVRQMLARIADKTR